jgi:hypothetical protein
MPTSQSKLERSIACGIILLGVLVACASNELLVAVFGVSLMVLGGALYLWGKR